MTPKNKVPKLLTETELELMTILWSLGEGTVHDVQMQLPPDRPLAYTSISTILRILEQKEFLKSRKQGRGHVYVPTLSKAEYEELSVKDLLDKVFENQPVALVRQLLNTRGLSKSDLEEIKKLLQQKLG